MRIASTAVRNSDELVRQDDEETEVVGIDEGQFFDANLPAACNTLADRGQRGVCAGLGSRSLSCWRLPNTLPRRWRSAWCAAPPRTTRSASSRAATACSSALR